TKRPRTTQNHRALIPPESGFAEPPWADSTSEEYWPDPREHAMMATKVWPIGDFPKLSKRPESLNVSCRDYCTMPHIPILKAEAAPESVKAVYEEFHKRMDFPSPPNFIMTQGHSPTVVRGTWEVVRNVLVTGEIPRWTKEIIFFAISKDRQCRYCAAAHMACCRMLGVKQSTLDELVSDVNSLTDGKLRQ